MMDGKMIDRPRPVAGLLFFNEGGTRSAGCPTRDARSTAAAARTAA